MEVGEFKLDTLAEIYIKSRDNRAELKEQFEN